MQSDKMLKKSIQFIFLLLINIPLAQSQDLYKAYYANNYKESSGNEDLLTSKKDFCLIHNDSYCLLSINNDVTFFSIKSYNKKLVKNQVQISFTNNETDKFPEGWFDITLNKNQLISSNVSINLPKIKGGYFYYIENATEIKPDSTFKIKKILEKWKDFQKGVNNENDILSNDELKEINDKDSIIAQIIDSVYSIGDNYNQQQIKWLGDLISSVVKVKEGETFYKDFKILIDANGYITRIFPVDRNDLLAKKYQNKINAAVIGTKLIPFKGTNGKFYRSYKTLYITLLSE